MDEADPLVGTTLDNSYTLVRVVGEGGMGRVYEARHTRIATRRFAIKTLHAEYLRDAGARARFKREAEAAASINSPHVAGVYDVGRTDAGVPYLVAEFLDGEDLRARLEAAGRMPVGPLVRIVRQVCKGLAAAHARGVVHRDIKPENVFLTGDSAAPTARIVDFGISRVDAEGTQLTKTGMIVGTPAYMAPEQARGDPVDARTDIYAVGAMLYRGLTGVLPFDRSEPAAVLAAVLLEEPRPPRSIEPAIPGTLELVIQRAMAKDPAARFPDIRELDAALAPHDHAAHDHAAHDHRAGPSRIVAPGARRPPAASLSSSNLGRHASDVQLARPMLCAYAAAGGLALFLGVWIAAAAITAQLRDGDHAAALSGSESAIVMLIAGGLALTPVFLFVRHVRSAWGSTMKVLALMRSVRAPVVAALGTYGALWLVVRAVEAVALRHALGVAWPVWDLLLLGAALFAAIYSARAEPSRSWLPRPATMGIATLLLLLSTALVGALRGDLASAGAAIEEDESAASPARRGKSHGTAAPFTDAGSASSRRRAPRTPSSHATPEDLAAARAGGITALEALAKRFPEDPPVLESLAIAQATQPNGQPNGGRRAALATLERILAVDPDATSRNATLERILRDAADGPPAESDAALSLMATRMGARGLDMLYELWISKPALKARIDAKLGDPAVKARAGAALAVAIDLRLAKGCEETAKLCERAARDGDERAAVILAPLIATSTTKCGFLGLQRCTRQARCTAQADAIQKAIVTIRGRAGK